MLLKRIYKKGKPQGESLLKDINKGEPLELDYIALAHTGVSPEQNFSTGLVAELSIRKIMEIKGDSLLLHVSPEDLVYKIKRKPGRYCLHCGEKTEDDATGELARLHVSLLHDGKASPDKNVPVGYEQLNHYECILNDKQHEKYRVKSPGKALKFLLKEDANG